MDLLQKKVDTARKAFRTFQEILERPFSKVMRDAAIQRFEYTIEAVWKSLQLFLREKEGIDCYSPKSCFREAGSVGLLSAEETVQALEMIDDRNLTSHTYHEEIAEEIYKKLPIYAGIMKKLLDGMKKYGLEDVRKQQ